MSASASQSQHRPRLPVFLREWAGAPLQVGAVAPSGPALVRAITDGVEGPVLELGPGTGVFTQALLERGVPPGRIAAIEAGKAFVQTLRVHFPEVAVIHGDAARLGRLSPWREVGCIVCGLPLLSMPAPSVLRILVGARHLLRSGGAMRLFTYGPRCPVPQAMLDRAGLRATRKAWVPANLPPASVYVLRRREDA